MNNNYEDFNIKLNELMNQLKTIDNVNKVYLTKLEIYNRLTKKVLENHKFSKTEDLSNSQIFLTKLKDEFIKNGYEDYTINQPYYQESYKILLMLQTNFIDDSIDFIIDLKSKEKDINKISIFKKYKYDLKYLNEIFNYCKSIIISTYEKTINKEKNILKEILSITK